MEVSNLLSVTSTSSEDREMTFALNHHCNFSAVNINIYSQNIKYLKCYNYDLVQSFQTLKTSQEQLSMVPEEMLK